jgi:hypothetical protein
MKFQILFATGALAACTACAGNNMSPAQTYVAPESRSTASAKKHCSFCWKPDKIILKSYTEIKNVTLYYNQSEPPSVYLHSGCRGKVKLDLYKSGRGYHGYEIGDKAGASWSCYVYAQYSGEDYTTLRVIAAI